MSEGKYTPGPWVISEDDNLIHATDPRATIVCVFYACLRNPDVMADAKLIAAAPELLGALEYFVNTVPAQGDETIIRAKEKANAAIRKVKGE